MEIENTHWGLVRYKNEHEIVELPLFCRFRSKETRNKLSKKLSEELEKEIVDIPKFLGKWEISLLPASHSVGLDFLYLAVLIYAILQLVLISYK